LTARCPSIGAIRPPGAPSGRHRRRPRPVPLGRWSRGGLLRRAQAQESPRRRRAGHLHRRRGRQPAGRGLGIRRQHRRGAHADLGPDAVRGGRQAGGRDHGGRRPRRVVTPLAPDAARGLGALHRRARGRQLRRGKAGGRVAPDRRAAEGDEPVGLRAVRFRRPSRIRPRGTGARGRLRRREHARPGGAGGGPRGRALRPAQRRHAPVDLGLGNAPL
jgi:hypothetical protein